jgi:hypothetical protein
MKDGRDLVRVPGEKLLLDLVLRRASLDGASR